MRDSILLQAFRGEKIPYTPVWLMRQAGRYLPEYQQVRKKSGDFLSLCHNPALASEVTLQPLRRFDLDAAIIFSDILVVLQALGLNLDFKSGHGPVIYNPIQNGTDIAKLNTNNVASLEYVAKSLQIVREKLPSNKALIGFAGSPWTVATYAVEGGSSKSFAKIKKMLYADSQDMHSLLEVIARITIEYLKMQIIAGADILMLFDSWAGVLTKTAYLEYSLKYLRLIVSEIKKDYPDTPIVIFSKNGGKYLDSIVASGCSGVGLDATANLSLAKSITENKVVLQGNLEPAILFGSKLQLEKNIIGTLEEYGNGHKHIFNLGHGVMPNTPVENVEFLVDTVKQYSRSYHKG